MMRCAGMGITGFWLMLSLQLVSLCPDGNALGAVSPSALDEENLVILEVRLDKRIIDAGMLAYLHGDDVLLPLGELSDALELAIDVDAADGYASGVIIDADRPFILDLDNRFVMVGGNRSLLPSDQAFPGENDIFVATAQLNRWLPIHIRLKMQDLHADIRALEALPVQSRLKREEMRDRQMLVAPYGSQGGHAIKSDYRLLMWPFIDAQLEMRNQESELTPRFSLQSTGDLAKLTTRAYFTHDPSADHPQTARLRLGRSDNDAGLLGVMGATLYEFGDVFPRSSPLLLRGKSGRGLRISNRPLYRPALFDATTIQGDAPPGWEVELRLNSTLLDFTLVDESGTYVFENVPLRYGTNIFKIQLYGPQGQIRSESRTYSIGADMLQPGEFQYHFSLVQDHKNLFYESRDPLYDGDPGNWSNQGSISYGLHDNFSLQSDWAQSTVDGERRRFATVGSGMKLGGYYLRSILARDLAAGYAGRFALQGNLWGRSLKLEQSLYGDYHSEINDQSTRMSADSQLRFGGNARIGTSPLAYDLNLQSIRYHDRSIARTDRMEMRLATNLDRISLSARLDFRHHLTTTGNFTQLAGDQLLSSWLGPVLLRAQLRYALDPISRLESISSSASWNPKNRIRLGARLLHSLTDQSPTNLQTSVSLLLDDFHVGVNTSLTRDGAPYFSLMVSTALTGDPTRSNLHLQRSRLGNSFAARARVFLDRNNNGRYDLNDEPLEGVGFLGNSNWEQDATNAEGQVFLAGLPAHRARRISVDLSTLDDPFLISTRKDLDLVGHPGSIAEIEFPITYSGDIEGMVYGETPSGRIPLRHVSLDLVNLSDYTTRSTTSEFDGYYIFQEVPPGWYEVRISSEALSRKQYRVPAPVSVPVSAEGGIAAGIDFHLKYDDIRQTSH